MTRRAELLSAARRVVERDGFAGATVNAITREAGASQGLLNYHFASRDEVLAEVFAQLAQNDLAELRAIEEQDADAPTRLAGWIASNDPADKESWRLWVDAWGTSLRADAVRRTLQEYRHGWIGTLRRTLEQGAAEGAWECADPAATAAAITAAVDGVGLQCAIHPEAVSVQEARTWIRELVERQVGVTVNGDSPAPGAAREPDASMRVAPRAADFDTRGHLRPGVQLDILEDLRTRAVGERLVVRVLELEHRRPIEAGDAPLRATCTVHPGESGLIRTTDRLITANDELVTVVYALVGG